MILSGANSTNMITVAVCTRDRPEYLEQTLKHILRQRANCSWELLVINNGASGPVDDVIATLESDVEIRVILEPEPGVDRARNRALQEARGGFIVFADDDVTVLPGWLEAYSLEFSDPQVCGVGGRIFPQLPDETARWTRLVSLRIGGPPGRYDFGKIRKPIDLERQSPPFGGNMGLRVMDARRVGGFSEAFGYGRRQVPGEDTEIFARLAEGGGILRYAPGATVFHRVPIEKLSLRYFVSWWRGLGVARTLVRHGGAYCPLNSAPPWPRSLRVLLKYTIKRARRAHLSPGWVTALEKQQVALGEVLEGIRRIRSSH